MGLKSHPQRVISQTRSVRNEEKHSQWQPVRYGHQQSCTFLDNYSIAKFFFLRIILVSLL